MIYSDAKNLMEYRSLKLVAKSAFQRPARNPAMGNYIVHRQIASGKVLLDVPKGACNVRVVDGENLGAFSRGHSLWRDSLGYIRWWAAVHQVIEQRCCFVGHSFQIMPDAG